MSPGIPCLALGVLLFEQVQMRVVRGLENKRYEKKVEETAKEDFWPSSVSSRYLQKP